MPPHPGDLSLVLGASTGPGVPDPVLQSSGVSQQLGPSCKCPHGHGEGMFPQPHGERSPRAKGTLGPGERAPLLPIADEGNANQHRAENIPALKKRFRRLNILGKAPLPFTGQISQQMLCPGKVQEDISLWVSSLFLVREVVCC